MWQSNVFVRLRHRLWWNLAFAIPCRKWAQSCMCLCTNFHGFMVSGCLHILLYYNYTHSYLSAIMISYEGFAWWMRISSTMHFHNARGEIMSQLFCWVSSWLHQPCCMRAPPAKVSAHACSLSARVLPCAWQSKKLTSASHCAVMYVLPPDTRSLTIAEHVLKQKTSSHLILLI